MKIEALYAKKLDKSTVICDLCPHECKLRVGSRGICGSRYNENGTLFTDNYGEVISVNIDPIEKKPLYHFYPGSIILSTGANGCNLGCEFCQNYQISREKSYTRFVSPEDMVDLALANESIGIAYTYTEPTIWYEYVLDTAQKASDKGLKNVLITNGFISKEPLLQIIPYIDAMNIDLKSFSDEFYKKRCKAKLQPVLDSIGECFIKTHIEITTLLIPGENDSSEEIDKITDFISNLSPNIPLHFSRYFPNYKMKLPSTSPRSIQNALEIARKKLNYVYAGNISLPNGSDTLCPNCGKPLIVRNGYYISQNNIVDNKCKFCSRVFDGKI